MCVCANVHIATFIQSVIIYMFQLQTLMVSKCLARYIASMNKVYSFISNRFMDINESF